MNTIVSRSEAEALKDMIFKRARERAEALNVEIESSYTDSVKNDVMELARDSFVSNNNPFSIKNEAQAKEIEEAHVEEVKSRINYRNKTESISNEVKEANMTEARIDFAKKQSFVGALDFLNSQASISLVNRKGKKFEAIA